MSTSALLTLFFIAPSGARKLSSGPADTFRELESKFPSEQELFLAGLPVRTQSFAGSIVVYANSWYRFPACTSSVITPGSVLTAAHGFPKDFDESHVELFLAYGLSNVREDSFLGNLRNPDVNIIQFYINKDVAWPSGYRGGGNFHLDDIVLVRLARPFAAVDSCFTVNGQPIGVSEGNSEGPLYEADENPVQLGVLSHGFLYQSRPPMNYVCIIPTVTQVFPRVSSFEEWIK